MKAQSSKFNVQILSSPVLLSTTTFVIPAKAGIQKNNIGFRVRPGMTNYIRLMSLCVIFFLLLAVHISLSMAGEKWQGVDESVVEKYAGEHGREAREPLINTDQGDLLLFVFLLAGVVGGFIGGYYWRTLTEKRSIV
jgi:hypothetical protein